VEENQVKTKPMASKNTSNGVTLLLHGTKTPGA
jgi:hypothetical protein